jgi:hypothetical protein
MSPYLYNPQALRALVRPQEVHRALYLDPSLFDLEMRQLWRNTWIYLGHDSQVPHPGDFYSTQVAREPLIMIRRMASRMSTPAMSRRSGWRENPKVLERELAMSRTGG